MIKKTKFKEFADFFIVTFMRKDIYNKTTQKILEILKENPKYTRKEIAKKIKDITEDSVKYNLEKLKKIDLIKIFGGDKGGYWEVL